MEIRYTTLLFNWINIALIIAILMGIFKGIREFKKLINRSKEIDKKLDIILNKLEKSENE